MGQRKRDQELRRGYCRWSGFGPKSALNILFFNVISIHRKPISYPEAAPVGREQRAGRLCGNTLDSDNHI